MVFSFIYLLFPKPNDDNQVQFKAFNTPYMLTKSKYISLSPKFQTSNTMSTKHCHIFEQFKFESQSPQNLVQDVHSQLTRL